MIVLSIVLGIAGGWHQTDNLCAGSRGMNRSVLSGISSERRFLACKAADKAKTVRKDSQREALAQSKAQWAQNPG